jgi:hypothetical protein
MTAPLISIKVSIPNPDIKIPKQTPINTIVKIISGILKICPCLDYRRLSMLKNLFLCISE